MSTKSKTTSHHRTLSCFITIAKLIDLLDQSNIKPEVKIHCGMGLKVIIILYADEHGDAGTSQLSNKAFDPFYRIFPEVYFENRGALSIEMIIEQIEACIKHDVVVEAWSSTGSDRF